MTGINRLFVAFCLFGPLAALAATSGTQTQNPFAGGLLVAWAIAHFSRRRPIGGWLLYCYIQMYFSLLISLIFVPQIADNLNPSGWDSSLRYVMFFLSTVPVILAELFEVYAATRLLIQRTEANLRVVQRAMIALVVTGAISFGLDVSYFQDAVTITFDTLTLIFAVIWAIYFHRAQRVRRVFIEHSWDGSQYDVPPRKRTPEEKRYLRKRTLWWSIGTFVAFLVLMGTSLGDKKPDAGIFFVPIFYAVIAALIAWYVPIRKKKLAELGVTLPDGSQQS